MNMSKKNDIDCDGLIKSWRVIDGIAGICSGCNDLFFGLRLFE